MPIPIYRPYVFLRCGKCGKKTDHVLTSIDFASLKEEKEETYECQEYGEKKENLRVGLHGALSNSSAIFNVLRFFVV